MELIVAEHVERVAFFTTSLSSTQQHQLLSDGDFSDEKSERQKETKQASVETLQIKLIV